MMGIRSVAHISNKSAEKSGSYIAVGIRARIATGVGSVETMTAVSSSWSDGGNHDFRQTMGDSASATQ
jgi:hypothetical protein